ncbi:MAG: YciI family protein [Pseudomonadota bacterium]
MKPAPILFVVLLRYLVPLDMILALRPAHVDYLKQCYDNGTFLVSGPQVPRAGGLILARAASRAALIETLERDPFYVHKAIEYHVYGFEVNMCAPELENILKPI